jgi:PAS domain S-box-containing protein
MGVDKNALEASLGPVAIAIVEAADAAGIGVGMAWMEDEPEHAFVNESLARMLGMTREELATKGPLAILPPADAARVRERFALRRDGVDPPPRIELELLRADGTLLPVEVVNGITKLDGRPATIAFVTDITARRRAEAKQQEYDQRFRKLFEAVPEAIAIMRGDRFLFANLVYAKILAFPDVESLLATPLSKLVEPEEIATQQRRTRAAFATEDALPQHTYRAKRLDGIVVQLDVTSVSFEFEGEAAILSIARDVTERRRMEAQLEQADRLAALGTLAAGVAHEVNNPLAYLNLSLEWLARQLPELARDPSRLHALEQMLAEARHGAERVGAIVRDLRSFSRADGEKRGPVDLTAAVASAIKMASHDMRHRANVVTEVEDDVPLAWANGARLEQVLLNLLLNAVQAMDESQLHRNEIRVTVRRGSAVRAIIEVADNGAGIAPEQLRRIFDPFFTTKSFGTGLGLSICHNIITSFGGRISVESRVGEGSTFRIELPTRSQVVESTPPASHDPQATMPPQRARVLVVDDEIAIGNTLRELLEPEHEVTAVTSGADALERVRRGEEYDVVLCDLMMPQMTGMEVYDRLREVAPGVEARVVFMTGGAFTTRASDFLARIPNRRVEKPFSITAVEQVVRSVAARAMRERGVA